MNGVTPGYLIREKIQREKIRSRARRRAWRFEKRLEEEREESWLGCAGRNRKAE